MTTTEQEIASAAARRSAGMRRRVTNICPVCGESFEGLTTRRYCSDRCRNRAARQESAVNEHASEQVPADPPFGRVLTDEEMELQPGENVADYFRRIRQTMFGSRRIFDGDVVELIRKERDARTAHLESLLKR